MCELTIHDLGSKLEEYGTYRRCCANCKLKFGEPLTIIGLAEYENIDVALIQREH